MKNTLSQLMTLVIIAILAIPLMTACASGGDGTEEGTFRLTFDGEECIYEGPTTLKAGPVTLLFFNESEGPAAVNLDRLAEDKTIQDLIDFIGEEPSEKSHPYWARPLGTWGNVDPGESHTWEGVLEPVNHTLVCARLVPFGVWFGTGLTVED
jgi:hypothetical protein